VFKQVRWTEVRDPHLPTLAPFNIAFSMGSCSVYAQQERAARRVDASTGIVDVFDTAGHFGRR